MCAGWSRNRPPRRRRADRGRREASAAAVAALLAPFAAAAAIGATELLPAERAFDLSVAPRDSRTVAVRFAVADGYYLYRDRLGFSLLGAALAEAPLPPPGKVKDDPFFGRVEILRGPIVVELRLAREHPGESIAVVVVSQGCADAGVCYPAQRQTVMVTLPQLGQPPGPPVDAVPKRKSWFN